MEIDFTRRFAGVHVYDDKEAERNRRDTEWAYRSRNLAREESAASFSDTVYSKASSDISSDPDSVASISSSYPMTIATVKNYTTGGKFSEAEKLVDRLRKSVADHSETYMSYAYTKPRPGNSLDLAVNAGAFQMVKYEFDNEKVVLPNGEEATIGQIYRDGGYRKYNETTVLRSGFTPEFAAAYAAEQNSENPTVKQTVLSRITKPLVSYKPRSDMEPAEHPLSSQYHDVGEYVVKEWDGLVDDLGERGALRLMDDVLTKRVHDGTALDTISTVRKLVKGRTGMDDSYTAVRRVINSIDRLVPTPKNLSSMEEEDVRKYRSEKRLASKVMSKIVEGSELTGADVNFDDMDTQARLDGLMDVFRRADKYRIPLLLSAHEHGQDSAIAMLNYATGRSDSNYVSNIETGYDMISGLFRAGFSSQKPVGSSRALAMVPSSGNGAIDSLVEVLESDMARSVTPRMLDNVRADIAIGSIARSQEDLSEIMSSWSDSLSLRAGFSKETADAIAAGLATSMFHDDGTVTPVDVKDVVARMAFDPSVNGTKMGTELIRWYKAIGLAPDAFRDPLSRCRQMLVDKTIGRGLDPASAELELARAMSETFVPLMERGVDPTKAMDAYASTATVYLPDDMVSVRGVGLVPVKEYEKAYDTASKKGVATIKRDGSRGVSVKFTDLANARLGVRMSDGPVPLTGVELPGVRGFVEGLPAGSWTRNRDGFLKYQKLMKMMLEASLSASEKGRLQVEKKEIDNSEPD